MGPLVLYMFEIFASVTFLPSFMKIHQKLDILQGPQIFHILTYILCNNVGHDLIIELDLDFYTYDMS